MDVHVRVGVAGGLGVQVGQDGRGVVAHPGRRVEGARRVAAVPGVGELADGVAGVLQVGRRAVQTDQAARAVGPARRGVRLRPGRLGRPRRRDRRGRRLHVHNGRYPRRHAPPVAQHVHPGQPRLQRSPAHAAYRRPRPGPRVLHGRPRPAVPAQPVRLAGRPGVPHRRPAPRPDHHVLLGPLGVEPDVRDAGAARHARLAAARAVRPVRGLVRHRRPARRRARQRLRGQPPRAVPARRALRLRHRGHRVPRRDRRYRDRAGPPAPPRVRLPRAAQRGDRRRAGRLRRRLVAAARVRAQLRPGGRLLQRRLRRDDALAVRPAAPVRPGRRRRPRLAGGRRAGPGGARPVCP